MHPSPAFHIVKMCDNGSANTCGRTSLKKPRGACFVLARPNTEHGPSNPPHSGDFEAQKSESTKTHEWGTHRVLFFLHWLQRSAGWIDAGRGVIRGARSGTTRRGSFYYWWGLFFRIKYRNDGARVQRQNINPVVALKLNSTKLDGETDYNQYIFNKSTSG